MNLPVNAQPDEHRLPEQMLGCQTPRVLAAPAAVSSAAEEAIELAAYCGLPLDPWQQLVLHHGLGERADGTWSSFEVGLCVPRQNGKSAIIEARMLAGLILFGEELITYSAHEFRTALEIMRRLERLLIASGEKFMPTTSHGQEGFEMGTRKRQGQRVLFQSRTKAAGLGTSGDCIILDEAMWLAEEAIGVLMPTMAARPNPQLWYAGSAVDQEMHPKGYVFSGVRKRGIEGTSPDLCYMEWSPAPDDDRSDRRSWLKTNPGAGYRPGFDVDYIAKEFEAMRHTPKMFDVMRWGLGDWPSLSDVIEPPISEPVWSARMEVSPALVSPHPQALGVDRDPRTKVWCVGGATRTTDGAAHLEIGFCENTVSVTEMVEYLLDVVASADPAALVIDQRSPAAVLRPYLVAAGVEPVMTNASELAVACEGMLEAVLAEQITHSGQPLLTDSVLSAVKRELPGGRFAWDKSAGGSIAQIMAVTLAHWGLLTFCAPPRKSLPPMADTAPPAEKTARERDFDAMSAPF